MTTNINTLKTLLGLGLVLACRMTPSLAAESAGQNGEIIKYKTAYEVPVKTPDLLPFAHLQMAATITKLPDGRMHLCYHLPWEIVSKSEKVPAVEFTTTKPVDQSTTEYDVEGEYAVGTCTFGAKSSCHLFYNDLNLDAAVTKTDLAKKFGGEELEKRSIVADIFSRDPEGILLLEAP